MLCHHCEEAPCEVVCPVEATLHDREGLNLMVYNRCIGTRFCSNNCPYKVRRFNFLPFTEDERRMAVSRNPDVTARARGVMEKCTFCVQRIAAVRIAADKEDRPIRDGEAVTACQAACPTQVFAFGNIADPDSAVAKRKQRLRFIQAGDAKRLFRFCAITALLGCGFLALKGLEWHEDLSKHMNPGRYFGLSGSDAGGAQLFWCFYWVATVLHGAHMAVGIGLVLWLLPHIRKGTYSAAWHTPVEVVGIYWSFVDVIWLILYPLIYLVGRPG